MKQTFNELKNLVGVNIARQIIMQYFSYSLLEYSLNDNKILSEFDKNELKKIAFLYKNNMPLQYIFKKTYIKDLEFICEQGVLIPREDTLVLIDLATKFINENKIKNVLEIGFGSGLVSIFLALDTAAKISACDINEKALKLANFNAKKHNAKCQFLLSDFEKLNFKEFDFIISNPPYISKNYNLDAFVKNEPANALYGGEFGYEILFKIIEKCENEKVKFLACEFGYDQKEILKEKLSNCGYNAEFYKDLNGFDRAFLAKRIENE